MGLVHGPDEARRRAIDYITKLASSCPLENAVNGFLFPIRLTGRF